MVCTVAMVTFCIKKKAITHSPIIGHLFDAIFAVLIKSNKSVVYSSGFQFSIKQGY